MNARYTQRGACINRADEVGGSTRVAHAVCNTSSGVASYKGDSGSGSHPGIKRTHAGLTAAHARGSTSVARGASGSGSSGVPSYEGNSGVPSYEGSSGSSNGPSIKPTLAGLTAADSRGSTSVAHWTSSSGSSVASYECSSSGSFIFKHTLASPMVVGAGARQPSLTQQAAAAATAAPAMSPHSPA